MPKFARRRSISIVAETTQGTSASETATDFINVEDFTVATAGEMVQRNILSSNLDTFAARTGKTGFEVTFKTEVKGSGTAGTAIAPLAAALEACGFDHTDGASTNDFDPTSTTPANMYGPATSCTIRGYYDGVRYLVAGCIGTVKLVAEVGKPAMFEFTFKGEYAEPTDNSPGTETPNSTLPPLVQGATISVMGTALICTKLEIDVGNNVQERLSMGADNGILGYFIGSRNPTGAVDPELDTVSAFNFWNKFISNTEAATSLVIGSTAGNIITFTCPKSQLTAIPHGDRNGLLTVEASLQFNRSSTGNDWINIEFS